MIFLISHKYRSIFYGHTAWICPRCNLPSAFECHQVFSRVYIYGIPIGSEQVDHFDCFCAYCVSPVRIHPPNIVTVSTTWRGEDGLRVLASETNPALSAIPDSRDAVKPQNADWPAIVAAVYNSATDRPPDPVVRRIGFALGLLLGAALALYYASSRQGDLIGTVFATLVFAAIGGSLGKALASSFNRATYRRDYFIMRLQEVASRNSVSIGQITSIAKGLDITDAAFRAAVKALDQPRVA